MQYKTCTKCGKELPATAEYFYRKSSSKDGFMSICKACDRQKSKEWRDKNSGHCEKYRKKYYNENRDAILDQKKDYWITNQENIKNYREINKEAIQKYRTKYNQKYYKVKQDQILQQKKKYYISNKEKIKKYKENNKNRLSLLRKNRYKLNRDRELQRTKLWRQNNKEKTRIYCQEYRAKKNGLPATLTVDQWNETKEYFNNRCVYCGKEKSLAQEHFVPLSKGGEYTHNNIIPACRSCNSSKNNKDFFEWYPQQPYYSKEREQKILDFLGYQQGIQQLTIAP